jgi:hypothetical protein
MIPNPTSKGKRTEAAILATLVGLGKSVLIPWNEERYDLVVDERDHFVRIQCKTGMLHRGYIGFKTCVADIRRPLGDGGYHGQIDAFGVYCPQNNRVYLVPITDVPAVTYAILRLDPPLNGQTTGIRWARKYEIGEFDVELSDFRP